MVFSSKMPKAKEFRRHLGRYVRNLSNLIFLTHPGLNTLDGGCLKEQSQGKRRREEEKEEEEEGDDDEEDEVEGDDEEEIMRSYKFEVLLGVAMCGAAVVMTLLAVLCTISL